LKAAEGIQLSTLQNTGEQKKLKKRKKKCNRRLCVSLLSASFVHSCRKRKEEAFITATEPEDEDEDESPLLLTFPLLSSISYGVSDCCYI